MPVSPLTVRNAKTAESLALQVSQKGGRGAEPVKCQTFIHPVKAAARRQNK